LAPRWLELMFQGKKGGEQASLNSLKDHQPQGPGPTWRFGFQSRLMPIGSIRLQRRGSRLEVAASDDGEKWTTLDHYVKIRMARKLKVGVLAEATAAGTFKAVFGQFRLSQPGK
jgi:hypothetical protein